MIFRWFTDDIPVAQIPNLKNAKRSQACIRCGQGLVVRRWDDWNSFLTTCPHCGGIHGKPRNIRSTLIGSILFHGLSFFFTMRPLKALTAVALVAPLVVGSFLVDLRQLPYFLDMVVAFAVVFFPMAINGAVLIRHRALLKKRQSRERTLSDIAETAIDLLS